MQLSAHMDFDLSHLHLADLGFQPWMTGVIIPVAGLIFVGVIVVTSFYFKHRERELWHQTARVALEKGQPLPSLPGAAGIGDAVAAVKAATAANNQPRWRGYLIGGLINLGVGAGLFFALSQISEASFNLGYFGCIPGFIGIALLLGAVIEALASRSKG